MEEFRQVIRDKRVISAVLRRARRESEKRMGFTIPSDTYAYPSQWGYIEVCGDWRKYSHYLDGFSGIEYKGKLYGTKYFDGCFKPFVVEECPTVFAIIRTIRMDAVTSKEVFIYSSIKKRDEALRESREWYMSGHKDAKYSEFGHQHLACCENGDYCEWLYRTEHVQ